MTETPPPSDEMAALVERARRLLEGDLVRLRGIRNDDLDAMARWNQEPAIGVLHSGTLAPMAESRERELFEAWGSDSSKGAGFSIETLEDGAYVGTLLLANRGVGRASLHITLGPDALGRGYGTDAVRVAVAYAFADMGVERLELSTFAVNTRAIAAYEKAGFEIEGRLRHAVLIAGSWQDDVLMSTVRKR